MLDRVDDKASSSKNSKANKCWGGAINSVLSALGVQKSRDEFESINLDDYRAMPDEDEE